MMFDPVLLFLASHTFRSRPRDEAFDRLVFRSRYRKRHNVTNTYIARYARGQLQHLFIRTVFCKITASTNRNTQFRRRNHTRRKTAAVLACALNLEERAQKLEERIQRKIDLRHTYSNCLVVSVRWCELMYETDNRMHEADARSARRSSYEHHDLCYSEPLRKRR